MNSPEDNSVEFVVTDDDLNDPVNEPANATLTVTPGEHSPYRKAAEALFALRTLQRTAKQRKLHALRAHELANRTQKRRAKNKVAKESRKRNR